jgi:hypothetical protein
MNGFGKERHCIDHAIESWQPRQGEDSNIIKLHKRTPEEIAQYLIDKYALTELAVRGLDQRLAALEASHKILRDDYDAEERLVEDALIGLNKSIVALESKDTTKLLEAIVSFIDDETFENKLQVKAELSNLTNKEG